jgi:hypothetical protein
MEKLTVDYTTIKNLLGKIPSYYVQQGDGGYSIYCVGDSLFIKSRLLGHETSNISDFDTNYKSLCTSTHSSDDALVLGNISNNIPLVQPRTTNGLIRTSSEKTEISKKNFFSHNWCDKTTWYTDSTRVENESPINSGDSKTYNLDNEHIIDVYHGKLFLEDFLKDSNGNSYKVIVKVNDVLVNEVDPHDNSGDYVVNYVNGNITFNNTLNPSDEVKVTYYYANSSVFIIKPDTNKKLNISIAEVQFSQDIVITDSIVFQPVGYVDVFAPHLVGALGSGTKIPLEDPVIYKTISDFQCDAFKAYPSYPVLSPSTWRGLAQPMLVFDWDYVSSTSIYEKYGMEIRVFLQHDIPFNGLYASASFYCMTEAF